MGRRVRATLAWSPRWEGPDYRVANPPPEYATKQWALGFIKKNLWRCDHIHDFYDLLQDAYLTFLKIATKYPRVMGQAHFMTLYRAAVSNEMHDRARYVRRKREQHLDTSVDAGDLCVGRISELSNEGYLRTLIEQAPEELKLALLCIGQNPKALHRVNGHRENLNMKLRRVLGYDSTVDIIGGIRRLLE